MEYTKWWLDSQTIRGVLMTAAPILLSLAKAFGLEIQDAEANAFIEAVCGVIGAIGVIYAIAGRFKARSNITLDKPNS